MRHLRVCELSWLILACTAVFAAAGQSAPPATQSAPQAGPPVPTIKTNAQLVVVDVVVTDSSHRPVHGLKAADFTLTENGKPQTLRNFDEHTAATTADALHMQPLPKLPPGTFSNYNPASTNGAVNLILLDTLNTPLRDQEYVRQQLLAYLKSVPPGTRVAIFGLTSRLVMLQGFTSDPEILRSVLEKNRGTTSPMLADQVGGGGVQESMADRLEDHGGKIDLAALQALRDFEADAASVQLQERVKFTLDAFNQLAMYLSNVPGRKNLIWFSGSFPINILPDPTGTLSNPFAVMARFGDEFRQTVDMLSRSQVAVYPVDATGITLTPTSDVTSNRNYGGMLGARRMKQDDNKYEQDTVDDHGTMNAMADATGGHAFFNTNDLSRAAAEAIDMGSNFYTLAYVPADSALDGKLHKIKVVSERRGLTLKYRQGYYAIPPEKVDAHLHLAAETPQDQAAMTSGGLSQQETLRLAMTRGAPTPTEILMKVAVAPTSPRKTEDTVPPGNSPTPKAHGPWRRYSLNYQIDARNLVFLRGADGKAHADFELIVFVYSPDGAVLNTVSNVANITEPMDALRQTLTDGVLCRQEVDAPAKGEYFVRMAVHDLHRNWYGAVEVATSQVKDVVAAEAPSSPAMGGAPPK